MLVYLNPEEDSKVETSVFVPSLSALFINFFLLLFYVKHDHHSFFLIVAHSVQAAIIPKDVAKHRYDGGVRFRRHKNTGTLVKTEAGNEFENCFVVVF